MAWREIEFDERHRTKWYVWRCSHCQRLAVNAGGTPSECVCLKKK